MFTTMVCQALIHGSSVGWLEMTEKSSQPTYMLFILCIRKQNTSAKILKHEFVSDQLKLTMLKTMHLPPTICLIIKQEWVIDFFI